MLVRKRVPRKQCPQCGWEAEGKPVDDPAAGAGGAGVKRVPPAPKYAFECDNCGQQWVE